MYIFYVPVSDSLRLCSDHGKCYGKEKKIVSFSIENWWQLKYNENYLRTYTFLNSLFSIEKKNNIGKVC